jgi:plasmid segregation protein ParM
VRSVGLDVGYGFVKVTDGNIGFSFPSVIGDRSMDTFQIDIKRNRTPVDNMQIKYKGKFYNVGKSAIKHSNYLYRDLSLARNYGNNFEIMFLMALSLLCNKKENDLRVVTGLPPQYMHMAEAARTGLLGKHEITINKDGEFQDIQISLTDLDIVPQPLGTFWAEYLTHGEDGFASIDGLKVGVIDVGFGTTDLAIIEDGEYIHEKSLTIPIGMSNTYKEVSSELFKKFGINIEIHSLDQIVIKRRLRLANKEEDISEILSESYGKIAENLIIEITSNWNYRELDQIIFTGGGSHELGKYLMQFFPQGTVAKEPFTANSRGYLAWAMQKEEM